MRERPDIPEAPTSTPRAAEKLRPHFQECVRHLNALGPGSKLLAPRLSELLPHPNALLPLLSEWDPNLNELVPSPNELVPLPNELLPHLGELLPDTSELPPREQAIRFFLNPIPFIPGERPIHPGFIPKHVDSTHFKGGHMTKLNGTRTVYRDAVTGRFVPKRRAFWSPWTTVREQVPAFCRVTSTSEPKGARR